MRAAARQWAALTAALDRHMPVCAGDPRFTAEPSDLDGADLAEMEAACTLCPIRDACRDYAKAARPTAGYWAGHHYTPRHARRMKEGTGQ